MSLLTLQRDFRTWLTEEAGDAAARLDRGRGAGPPVYLNNYRGQLMACLTESFPTVRAWLGDAGFEGAAAHHIDRQPPHSWTLDAYALDFPQTLAILYPDDPEVVELARLECALGIAFVGADAAPVDPAKLAGIDWDRAVLHFVPTLAVLPAGTNAGAIWSAIAAGQTPPAAANLPEPAHLAVWRHGFTPSFRTIEAAEAEALACARGAPFATLCAHLIEAHGEGEGLALAGALLGQWLRDGLIASLSPD
jgi:hypothetical protein